MILSLSGQAYLFFTAVIIGGVMGLLYDSIKIIRMVVKHNNIFIQLEDGLYWIFVIILMFSIMLDKNYGEVRFFSILGVFLGMGLYFLTVSRVIIGISDCIISAVGYIIKLFVTIILTPFKIIYAIIKKPVENLKNLLRKQSKKALHLSKSYVKIKRKKLKHDIQIMLRKR